MPLSYVFQEAVVICHTSPGTRPSSPVSLPALRNQCAWCSLRLPQNPFPRSLSDLDVDGVSQGHIRHHITCPPRGKVVQLLRAASLASWDGIFPREGWYLGKAR